MAMKTKTKTMKSAPVVHGGKTKMFGKQGADPVDAGKISVSDPATGQKFAKGGSTSMFGYTGAQVAKAGCTAK